MTQKNNTRNCDVTVVDIDVAQYIWVKDIDAQKGKTTHKKSNPVEGYMIKITKELIKLNKTVFLTVDIFL